MIIDVQDCHCSEISTVSVYEVVDQISRILRYRNPMIHSYPLANDALCNGPVIVEATRSSIQALRRNVVIYRLTNVMPQSKQRAHTFYPHCLNCPPPLQMHSKKPHLPGFPLAPAQIIHHVWLSKQPRRANFALTPPPRVSLIPVSPATFPPS
jgi:hypothetical protein